MRILTPEYCDRGPFVKYRVRIYDSTGDLWYLPGDYPADLCRELCCGRILSGNYRKSDPAKE